MQAQYSIHPTYCTFPKFHQQHSLDYNIWVGRPYPLSSKCSEKPRPIPAALFLLQCVLRVPAQWHFQSKHFREIHDLLNNKPTEAQIESWDLTDTGVKSKTPVQKNWFFFLFLNHSPAAGAQISCSVKSFQILNCVLPAGQCTIKSEACETTGVLLSQAGLATALSKANLQKHCKRLTFIFKFFQSWDNLRWC